MSFQVQLINKYLKLVHVSEENNDGIIEFPSGLSITKRQADKEVKEELMNTSQQQMSMKGVDSSNGMSDELPTKESMKSSELLLYNTMMGHISFKKLREISKQGIIPK